MKLVRKIYGSPDPLVPNDLITVTYESDEIEISGKQGKIYLTPRAADRLASLLVENEHLPAILKELEDAKS